MRTMVTLLVASVLATLGAMDASAKPRRHRVLAPQLAAENIQELPLTVNRRSFLDPGPVAPVGTGQNYVAANTIFRRTEDRIRTPDSFGNAEFPNQPYIPGRPVPVAEFATGPRIGDFYSGPFLGYQP